MVGADKFEVTATPALLTTETNSKHRKPGCADISYIIIHALLMSNDKLYGTHVENMCSPVKISLLLNELYLNKFVLWSHVSNIRRILYLNLVS